MAAGHIPHPGRSGRKYFQGRSVGDRIAPGRRRIGSGGALVADRAAFTVEVDACGHTTDRSRRRYTDCARISILGPVDGTFSKRSS